jgi:hypothetical protein
MKEKRLSISNVERIVKGTHDSEACSRVGIDSACSLLKGNGHTQGNLECQTKQRGRNTNRKGSKEVGPLGEVASCSAGKIRHSAHARIISGGGTEKLEWDGLQWTNKT